MAAEKIYEIYIKNYKDSNGNTVTQETLLHEVPFNPVLMDQNVILLNPVVKTEMGKTGSFEFGLYPNNPYYSAWNQLKTIMRVTFDGETLFRGRVLTVDSQPFTGEEKIHCEGDLAFLMDSFQEGIKEEDREEITILQYLQNIINEHNRQMTSDGDPDKVMTLGEVPGQYSNAVHDEQKVVIQEETFKYGESSYQSTTQRLESLLKQYGGYLRTRYENGICYLDWLDYCFRYDVNTQPIELGLNLIELSGSTEVDNIFTAVVPIGKNEGKDLFIDGYRTDIHGEDNKRILVPQIVSLYTDAELNKGYHHKADYVNAVSQYGIIYKTQNFPNADTQEKLWNYCVDWIKENYAGGINTLNVRAVDLFHSPKYFEDGTPQKILSGDRVTITYPDSTNLSGGTITKTLTVLSVTHNLYNPEKNDQRIGIPNNQLNRTYGVSSKKGGGGGASGGIGDNNSEEELMRLEREARWSEYRTNAWNFIIDAQYNSDIYKDLMERHSEKEMEYVLMASHLAITEGLAAAAGDADPKRWRKMYNTITLDGTFHRLEFNDKVHVDPLASWTDEDFEKLNELTKTIVVDAVGKSFDFKTTLGLINSQDPSTWTGNPITKSRFSLKEKKDETGTVTAEEGQLNIWNEAKKLFPDAEATINLFGEDGAIGNVISKIGLDGSGNAATIIQDGLTSVTQYFNPDSVAEDPSNPTKTVEIDGDKGTEKLGPASGGQWKVKLNNTVTYTDESGHSHTLDGFVSADDFSIPSIDSFKTKLIVVDQLIADRATIGQLEAEHARIDDIETNYLKTADLASTIGSISTLSVNNLNATAIGSTGPVSCKTLSVNGTEYSYQAITFVTDVGVTLPSFTLSSAYNFMWENSAGETKYQNGRIITSSNTGGVNPTTKTIYVLGGIPSG